MTANRNVTATRMHLTMKAGASVQSGGMPHRGDPLAAGIALCLSVAILGASQASVSAAIISFNLRSQGGTPMGSSETAGAPGVNVARWNNVLAAAGGTTLSAGSIVDDAGSTVAGMAMTISAPASLIQYPGSGTNDTRMFSSAFDGFGASNQAVDGISDLTATITGIPFTTYDVYAYFPSTTFQATVRGGEVWANGMGTGQRQSLRHLGAFLQSSYVEVDSAAAFSTTTTPQGTYVVFSSLTGSTLTLDWDAQVRFPVAGFQIVDTTVIPTPAALPAGLGVLALAAMRARARRVA